LLTHYRDRTTNPSHLSPDQVRLTLEGGVTSRKLIAGKQFCKFDFKVSTTFPEKKDGYAVILCRVCIVSKQPYSLIFMLSHPLPFSSVFFKDVAFVLPRCLQRFHFLCLWCTDQ